MPTYIPMFDLIPQFIDPFTNAPMAGGKMEFYVRGTTTPANVYSDDAGTVLGTIITIGPYGYPQTDAGAVTEIFRDSNVQYKMLLKSQDGGTIYTMYNMVSPTAFVSAGWYAYPGGSLRSIASKIQETVSVKDFGAVGDGVTDDTAAIQSAIETDRIILFPKGIYIVSSTINIDNVDNVRLVSSGNVQFKINSASGYTGSGSTPETACMLYLSGCSHLEIKGISFNPDTTVFAATFPASEYNHAIYLTNCDDVMIHDCDIKPPRGDGVYIGGTSFSRSIHVEYNYIHDCRRLGVGIVNLNVGNVSRNRIYGRYETSIYGGGVNIEPTATGQYCNNINVNENYFSQCGINIYSRSTEEGKTNNCNIVNNTCSYINIQGLESGDISGNSIAAVPWAGSGYDFGAALLVYPTSTPGVKAGCNRKLKIHGNNIIINNSPTDPHSAPAGIVIAAATDCLLEGNAVATADSISNGIRVGSGIRLRISSNKVKGFTNAFYIDSLDDYNDSSVSSEDASDNINISDNEFYGRVNIINVSAQTVWLGKNNIKQTTAGTHGAIYATITSTASIYVSDNTIYNGGDTSYGAIHLTSDATALSVVKGNTIYSTGKGVDIRSSTTNCTVDSNLIHAPTPIQLNDTASPNITNNTINSTASETYALFSNGTSCTATLAGNVLLQTYTTPWHFQNTGYDAKQQYMTSDQSPGTGGWANGQKWSAGHIIYNSAPTAGGVIGWVCTTTGTPGTWKTFGAIAA